MKQQKLFLAFFLLFSLKHKDKPANANKNQLVKIKFNAHLYKIRLLVLKLLIKIKISKKIKNNIIVINIYFRQNFIFRIST